MNNEPSRDDSPSFATRAAKAWIDGGAAGEPLSIPIVQATTFRHPTSEELGRQFLTRDDLAYTRFGHPTLTAVADHLARIEEAESALLFSSGMGAIATTLIALVRPGDHVVAQGRIFAQTRTLFQELLHEYGVTTTFVDATNPGAITAAMTQNTKLLYIETPSNPTLDIVDIAEAAALARLHGVRLVVDNTFASPYLQRPLELGADLSVQSASKFLAGHADVLCGVVSGSRELLNKVKGVQILLGGILDPHAAWLLARGLRTLAVRMNRSSATAQRLAEYLAAQSGIRAVYYPWLKGSPGYDVARRQMSGGGGVVSFEVDGGIGGARAFLHALELIPIATSLGGVETVIEIPYELDWAEEELGTADPDNAVPAGLIRLSVGLEDPDDLARDLDAGVQGLARG